MANIKGQDNSNTFGSTNFAILGHCPFFFFYVRRWHKVYVRPHLKDKKFFWESELHIKEIKWVLLREIFKERLNCGYLLVRRGSFFFGVSNWTNIWAKYRKAHRCAHLNELSFVSYCFFFLWSFLGVEW